MKENNTCIQQLFNTRISRKWLLADTLARELENKDGKDRIVLLADEEYSILTLEECCETFSHYEDEHVEEIHIEEAFYSAQDGIPLYAFFDLILSVKADCSDFFTRAYTMLFSENFIMEEVTKNMDSEICMMLRQKLSPCSDLLYLAHYLKEHWERFGNSFVWN